MPLNESASMVVSSVLALLTFSSMQIFKSALESSPAATIAAGFLGSLVFVFLLTAVGNFERTILGKGFQTKGGEVVACLGLSIMASSSIHRVAGSTCLLFSLAMTYGMLKISQDEYGVPSAPGNPTQDRANKKKK